MAPLRRGVGEGDVELVFNGYTVSVLDDGKFLEIDTGGGCKTML